MASRKHLVDAFAQGRFPTFDCNHVACPHQGRHCLPEGLPHMQIRAPVRIKGEQDSLGAKGLQDGERLAPHRYPRDRYGEQTAERGGHVSLQLAFGKPNRLASQAII